MRITESSRATPTAIFVTYTMIGGASVIICPSTLSYWRAKYDGKLNLFLVESNTRRLAIHVLLWVNEGLLNEYFSFFDFGLDQVWNVYFVFDYEFKRGFDLVENETNNRRVCSCG